MIEVWKDVIGYEGLYKISSLGNVKALMREVFTGENYHTKRTYDEKIMQPEVMKKGYLRVGLHKDGVKQRILVHRLVAIHFIENPLCKEQVNHINGVKSDNRAENLEWSTGSENVQHAFDTGLAKRISRKGEQSPNCVFSDEQILGIKIMANRWFSHEEVAKAYGCSRSYVGMVVSGLKR